MKHIIVYAGPSLGVSEGKLQDINQNLIFEVRRPARAGDILNTVIEETKVDGIILADGYFYENYSPMHREIIFAINSGIKVIGCSSMGALRAVELENHGMIGHGEVFEFYKKYPETSDDEVGLIHETTYPYSPITIPLINLRVLLTKLKKPSEVKAVENTINYLSSISFDKRFFNENYYKNNNLTPSQIKDFNLMISLYKDFKAIDLQKTIKDIDQLMIVNAKEVSTINSEINSIRLYIKSGRYLTHQYLMSPHRKVGEQSQNLTEVDIRDLLAIGHSDFNNLLTLTAIRSQLLDKAMEQHFDIQEEELKAKELMFLETYNIKDKYELGRRLKLTQFELRALLFKEIMIEKSLKAEVKSQQTARCVGNIMDTLRASGHYPEQEIMSTIMLKAKELVRQMSTIFNQHELAKLAKTKILLKGNEINEIQIPKLEALTNDNKHQKTKRVEIIEAITRLLKPIV